MLAEVNNTFGERHNYLLAHADGAADLRDGEMLRARKVFHVSPFCAVEGRYRFRFRLARRQRSLARIDYDDADGRTAAHRDLRQRRSPGHAGAAAAPSSRYPLLTLGVVLRIHWQALRLWLKRVPFFRKPAPPLEETTR